MKKNGLLQYIYFVFLFIILISFTGYCEESNSTTSLTDMINEHKLLKKKIQELEQKLSDKKNEAADDCESVRQELDELSRRLDVTERKGILDRINFSGELRTRMDDLDYDKEVNGKKGHGTLHELWSNRFRLNIRADINDNLVLHGRLSYYKFWGYSKFEGTFRDWDYAKYHIPEGTLHVERVYVDYFLPKLPIAITFGRLPGSEGPPYELKEYTTRKSTWPSLMNDIEVDGIITTIDLNKISPLKNTRFRLAYCKSGQNYLKYKNELNLDDTRLLAIAFESELPQISNSLFWLSYSSIINKVPMGDTPPLDVVNNPDSAGDMHICTLHVQVNKIKQTGLSLFASISFFHFTADPDGSVLNINTDFGSFYYNEVGFYGDRNSGTLGKDRNAYCVYAGFNYALPIPILKNPELGIEYNHGSKYWTGLASSGDRDIRHKFDVNGDAVEIYYVQPISDRYMFLRIGSLWMDYDYFNPMYIYGNQRKSDMVLKNYYVVCYVRF
ncbi:MAG: DUF3373 family protein [Desulfobacterales bacterium]|nr:DUF3373 family protein [Desulfobacterales bacterium]